jgi:SAM-dependent methyltransferase
VPHDHHRQHSGHRHNQRHAPGGHEWTERAAHLEREGEVTMPLVLEAIDVLAAAVGAPESISRVLDLGSGAGAASVALAQRFPFSSVTAVDGARRLLDLVDARAAGAGLADRVTTVVTDLETPLGGLAPAGSMDVIWASMVLHHVAALPQTLTEIHRLLRRGGLLAVVEFGRSNGGPPAGFDVGVEGFAERFAEVVRAVVEDHLPPGALSTSWPAVLSEADFELLDERELELKLPAPLDEAARHLVLHQLQGLAPGTARRLTKPDREVLDALMNADDPRYVLNREDVPLEISRSFLLARRY